jgi:hypothetical protein
MNGNGNGNGNGDAVATLSDDLVAKARKIASRSDELLELLEDARLRLVDPDRKPLPKDQAANPRRGAKSDPNSDVRAKEAKDGDVSDGLRLLITQLTVAGIEREQIAAQLSEDFDVDDPESVLKRLGL